MKKILSLLLLTLILVIAGCSQSAKEPVGETKPVSLIGEQSAEANYPTKPIEFIIPFSAGGVTDSLARILAEGAQKYLPNNQTIVPVNTPGAGGSIGMSQLLTANPDGYTIAFANTDSVSVQSAFGEANYEPDSFQPILKVAAAPWVLAVLSDSPWKSFEDLVEHIKQNPGQFSYGTPFVGSPSQIAMEYLKIQEKLDTKPVPYNGSELIPALLGGNIDAYTGTPASIAPYKESGEANILINFGETKIDGYEDIPTLKDKGFDIAMDLTFGIVAPKGINDETQQILHDAFKKATEDPAVIEKIEKLNIAVLYANADDLQKEFTDTAATYKDVLKEIGLLEK